MIFDIEMISSFYRNMPAKLAEIRNVLKRPLTVSEKILYTHLFPGNPVASCNRGVDYVDFAPDRVAMQDATAQMALLQFMMAGKKQTAVPSSVHCDHLIMAKSGAEADMKTAFTGNKEVYDFLSTVCNKYNIGFWNPGAGIIHQIVLENYAFPGGMMIGTDSHTPNAGGLGMVAIGVGGADAVDVMTGMAWELKLPRLIGIKLTGRLNGWASPKDIILKVAGILSVSGGTGCIVEYFGEGAEALSSTGKATICNMGAEIGATCSLFGYDEAMARYLTATGRKEVADMALAIGEHLRSDIEVLTSPEKYYDQYLEINLSELEPYINGPFTPDLATPISKMKETAEKYGWPVDIEVGLIGSCTNSSYEDISRAASVVKNALAVKLSAKSEFKITPGSEQIKHIAERDGYLKLFEEIGGEVFANACGPCIGQWDRKGSDKSPVNSVIHSFNRNFAKRTDGNPNTNAFVASPEIVTAIAISGKLTFNPLTDTLINKDGEAVKIAEPSGFELPPNGFGKIDNGYQEPSKDGRNIEIAIAGDSDRLQYLSPFGEWDGKDYHNLPLLIKAKGKCTTDHISMAGFWLKYRGHLENISNNYMIGAINFFNNKANEILNQLTGKYDTVPAVTKAYKSAGIGSVVVGEENFGEGSSREHAAMEPRYLNVKAVLVKSFARIHETNLKKQGILPLTFTDKSDYDRIRESDKICITGLHEMAPGKSLRVVLQHSDETKEEIAAIHTYNESQIDWFRAGSALNLIRKSMDY
ncbi:MAG: aconitate hydratase [Bacteroidetes bacterium GWE2_41_25]|nr:MAG: aconitate hydratase [Bacteroidetes bacterium GWA2_40_15]OFX93879.1 MAG: aconitate hydratase [Bacteroidetes bacterium GWE2_41_25]OFX99538.1 MAG: aconitate hydratase [Bacteroidetes bacterium GWC2_40_22]OFY56744.1 MAG: aconitate hydratase [Bacteroidetes bacterium GWF2_41_9]HAM10980.1 aconitate hydratase [Bacteroidales bacterium]